MGSLDVSGTANAKSRYMFHSCSALHSQAYGLSMEHATSCDVLLLFIITTQ